MTFDNSIIGYFLAAGFAVKAVMLILIITSFASWVIIFQRWLTLRWTLRESAKFQKEFWATDDLAEFYNKISAKKSSEGLEKIFITGFQEFIRLQKLPDVSDSEVIERVQRAMHTASMQESDHLETHLSFLATVGSTSPYVGLFGTVWGIMTSFQSLGHVEQATISMVAPGISEALIATAMGLFAAIPAVIAYNRYSNIVDRILNSYETFRENFSSYLFRQIKNRS